MFSVKLIENPFHNFLDLQFYLSGVLDYFQSTSQISCGSVFCGAPFQWAEKELSDSRVICFPLLFVFISPK